MTNFTVAQLRRAIRGLPPDARVWVSYTKDHSTRSLDEFNAKASKDIAGRPILAVSVEERDDAY